MTDLRYGHIAGPLYNKGLWSLVNSIYFGDLGTQGITANTRALQPTHPHSWAGSTTPVHHIITDISPLGRQPTLWPRWSPLKRTSNHQTQKESFQQVQHLQPFLLACRWGQQFPGEESTGWCTNQPPIFSMKLWIINTQQWIITPWSRFWATLLFLVP